MIYPINFPAQAPATQRLEVNRRQSVTESTWTFKQTTVHTASQWVLQWSWPRVNHATSEAIAAWLGSLKGQVGTFRYYPRQRLTSPLTGRTLHLPGYAYNDALSVGGWGASSASGLRLGQFLQVGEQLLRITNAPAFADANGNVTIEFEPELRADYASGTAVNFVNPCGLFRLAASEGLAATLDPDKLPDFGTISAREAI